MTIYNLQPRVENLTGADFSGSNGDSGRTYTYIYSNYLTDAGSSVRISGTFQYLTDNYTLSAADPPVITIVGALFDDEPVQINYDTGIEATGASADVVYCTATDVARYLQLDFTLGAGTTPTETDVEQNIIDAQDEIDRQTHHAWRESQVLNEFYNFPTEGRTYSRYGLGGDLYTTGLKIDLRHRKIKDFDTNEGDKLEIWNGTEYVDWITTKTEGRADDFWIDQEQGMLYVRYFYPFFIERAIRLSYRFGDATVPNDIRKATAMLAAIDYISSDDRSSMLNETGDPTRMSYSDRIQRYERKIDKILHERTELITI